MADKTHFVVLLPLTNVILSNSIGLNFVKVQAALCTSEGTFSVSSFAPHFFFCICPVNLIFKSFYNCAFILVLAMCVPLDKKRKSGDFYVVNFRIFSDTK